MFFEFGTFCAILCAVLMFSFGCNKKVAKIESQAGPAMQPRASPKSPANLCVE